MFSGTVTFDGEWIRLSTTASTDPVNKLWLAKLENKSLPSDGTTINIPLLTEQENWNG